MGDPSPASAEEAWALPAELKTSTTSASPPPTRPSAPERLLVRGPQVVLRVQGGVASGALPGSGPVLGLSGALQVDPLRYAIYGRLRFSRDTVLVTARDRIASVDLWSVGARVCPEIALFFAWYAHGCLGVEGGRFRAEEAGLSATELWAGALISGAVRAEIAPPFGLWLGTEAGVTLVDAEYAPEEASVSTGSLFWLLEFGVEVRLD